MKNQFEKHIHDAMSNHEVPVSDSVWASIQQKQSKKPFIYYIGRVSAACLLLFTGFFTFYTYDFSREDLNTIVVEQKKVSPIDYKVQQPDLKKVLAEVPVEPIYETNDIYKQTTAPKEKQNITIPQKEVIVLTIKPRQRKKRNTLYNITPQFRPQSRTQVDSEILLTQIEEKLSKKNKKAFESYLADIKKLASKNSINDKIQTAQNWIAKTASDIGITNQKRKNND